MQKSLFYFILGLIIIPSQLSLARNFYFSSTIGNDNNTFTQAQNENTPWQTIDRLNKSMSLFAPGDSILFKSDETFIGSILLKNSGSSSNKIVFSSYGKGLAPIIKGIVPVTSWSNYDGNIWVADCPSTISSITNLLINGKSQQIGRYPNVDAPNKGYLNIDTHEGKLQVSSNSLPISPNWTGAEAVIRSRRWIIDRVKIESHYNNTLYLESPTTYEVKDNFGFFIQNHVSTLDQDGEWFYNPTLHKIYLYYSAAINDINVEVTAYNSIFDAINESNFSIENIKFIGSILKTISISFCNNIEIKNIEISESGTDALFISNCKKIDCYQNKIINTNNNAIILIKSINSNIRNNNIQSTAMKPGMGLSSDGQYNGIFLDGSNINCELNTIDNVGYNGIIFYGDTITIKNNFINHFCIVKDDGGGIYTNGTENISNYNRTVEANIILNGMGAGEGTNDTIYTLADGIYIDNRSINVSIKENTVANCTGYGICIHNSNHLSITKNTLYNNFNQIVFTHDEISPNYPINNCLVQDNIFYSKTNEQFIASLVTVDNDISSFGLFDNNYYCRPINELQTIRVIQNSLSIPKIEILDLGGWQEKHNMDLNSSGCNYKLPIFKILGALDSSNISKDTFESDFSFWKYWSSSNNSNISWDNSGKLDNGCLQINCNEPLNHESNLLYVYKYYEDVKVGQNYILSFSLLSNNPDQKIHILLQNGNATRNLLAEDQYIMVSNKREEYVLLFTPDSSELNARIDFVFEENGTKFWLDNVEFYPANIQIENTIDSINFSYNPTIHPKSLLDYKYYKDIKGELYYNPEIQSFKSLILIKVDHEIIQTNVPIQRSSLINIYPNPASLSINVETNNIGKISINDINGKIIYQNILNQCFSQIDIGSFSKGIYIVKFEDISNKVSINKLIIN
jgi:parallel beta-helix repeat protein